MALDHDGRRLLAARAARDPAFWAEVADTPGSDPDSLVTLTVDAAARVVHVDVGSPDRLRDPRVLERLVQDAYRAADTARAVAVQLAGPTGTERVPATQEEVVAALRPRTRRAVDVARWRPLSDPTAPVAEADGSGDADATAPTSRSTHGLSDNGYLEVELGVTGDPVAVRADGAWLGGATAGTLAAALLGAFRQAHDQQARLLDTPTATPTPGGSPWPTH